MRKSLILLVSLAVLVGVSATPAISGEVDLSGEWTFTMEGESPSGQQSAVMTFDRDGHNLVANMKGEGGTVKCRGWIDGNEIRFYYIRPTSEGEFVAKYTGHVAGDLMGGPVDLGDLGQSKWRATRGPAKGIDLTGQWKLTMEGDSPSGQSSAMLSFRQDGHHLMVDMTGQQGTVEMEGYIDGNAIRFYYIRPTEEGEFVAKYTGHVANDMMGGEVDMGEMGKTTWKATRGAE